MKKAIAFAFLALFLVTVASPREEYADLSLKVDEAGIVYFSGSSSLLQFSQEKSEYFTSKKGPYWLLNITTKEIFSDYFISVEFPKATEINYIKTSGGFRIAESPSLTLIASGRDEPVEIVVQYRLDLDKEFDISSFAKISSIILFTLLLVLFTLKASKKFAPGNKSEKMKAIMHTLSDNQKLIMEILQQARDPITQKQLLHRTGLPKATLSRNLELLRQKNIVTKQSRGMVNVIFLNKDLEK